MKEPKCCGNGRNRVDMFHSQAIHLRLCVFLTAISPLFLFPGDLASLFVDRADSRHCQNGALLVASLLTSENNDVHNPFHCHLHHFHTVPQHITPPYIHARRLREDGKKPY